MSIQSAQFNQNVSPGVSQAGRDETQVQGRFLGARVTQELDPMSLLAEQAEELTLSMEEGEETRLDERKEKVGVAEKEKQRANRHIGAARIQAQAAEEKFGQPLNHLEQLFKVKNNAELAELMGALKQALAQGEDTGTPDPADEFILLVGLKDRLGKDHPLAGTLDRALDDLAETRAFAVASGLAVDLAA
ncbi:MAG: hypothetical protein LBH94_07415, partial [Deltaproteobacteria bacterium]|nr:hypothetical protein [Deltaproteobacteria bacterium]